MIKKFFSKMGWKTKSSKPSVLLQDFSESDSPSSLTTTPGGALVTPKKDSAEVFQEAVEKLVGKLEHINDNLASQVEHNKQLVERLDALGPLLSPLPKAVDEQRQAFAQVADQLRQKVARDEKVAVELSGIHEKVAAAAETDARLCDSFGTFSETLKKLDNDTVTHTEWLEQINRTFSASEHYFKDAIGKQQVRFYWIFGISLAVCLLAIAALITGIILLKGGPSPN